MTGLARPGFATEGHPGGVATARAVSLINWASASEPIPPAYRLKNARRDSGDQSGICSGMIVAPSVTFTTRGDSCQNQVSGGCKSPEFV